SSDLSRAVLAAGCIFFFAVFVYSHVVVWWHTFDNSWYVPAAMSLNLDGNLDVSEFTARVGEAGRFVLVRPEGREGVYNYFPIGPSLAAAPVTRLGFWTNMVERDVEHVTGAIVAALSVPVLFLIGRQLGLGWGAAVLISMLFGFASTQLSSNAGALWSHTVSTLAS